MRKLAVLALGLWYPCAMAATTTAHPAVQAEDETSRPEPTVTPVIVTNFPSVQAVTGSIGVENLPIADDGSIRVTSGPARASTIELLSAPITLEVGGVSYSPSVNVAGYSRVVLRFVRNIGDPWIESEWRFDPDDDFIKVRDLS